MGSRSHRPSSARTCGILPSPLRVGEALDIELEFTKNPDGTVQGMLIGTNLGKIDKPLRNFTDCRPATPVTHAKDCRRHSRPHRIGLKVEPRR
jgi:hypothetical protein